MKRVAPGKTRPGNELRGRGYVDTLTKHEAAAVLLNGLFSGGSRVTIADAVARAGSAASAAGR